MNISKSKYPILPLQIPALHENPCGQSKSEEHVISANKKNKFLSTSEWLEILHMMEFTVKIQGW